MRGSGDHAATAIEHANRNLANFSGCVGGCCGQNRICHELHPARFGARLLKPGLGKFRSRPRTFTRVRLLLQAHALLLPDWLLDGYLQISGEAPVGVGDELRLSEDLQLDSLGRVQLAAALEERLGITPDGGLLEHTETLGELRQLIAGETEGKQISSSSNARDEQAHDASENSRTPADSSPRTIHPSDHPLSNESKKNHQFRQEFTEQYPVEESTPGRYIYPRWPWLQVFQWLRVAFLEAVERPLVWLLANPKVVASAALTPGSDEPLLIIANHVTAFDGPLNTLCRES